MKKLPYSFELGAAQVDVATQHLKDVHSLLDRVARPLDVVADTLRGDIARFIIRMIGRSIGADRHFLTSDQRARAAPTD